MKVFVTIWIGNKNQSVFYSIRISCNTKWKGYIKSFTTNWSNTLPKVLFGLLIYFTILNYSFNYSLHMLRDQNAWIELLQQSLLFFMLFLILLYISDVQVTIGSITEQIFRQHHSLLMALFGISWSYNSWSDGLEKRHRTLIDNIQLLPTFIYCTSHKITVWISQNSWIQFWSDVFLYNRSVTLAMICNSLHR